MAPRHCKPGPATRIKDRLKALQAAAKKKAAAKIPRKKK
jgi:hypothetical protein